MRTELVIEAEKGRVPRITSTGGIAARITGPDTVHLIGTAQTPMGGDVTEVRVSVEDGARLTVRSVAAAVALPGRHTPHSASNWVFEVGSDGYLDWEPEPTIVASRAEHETVTDASLTVSSTLRVHERIQIGRSGEYELGFWRGTLNARVDKSPLVVHTLELGRGDALGVPRALISELSYPGLGEVLLDERTGNGSGVTLPLARGGSLTTWMGEGLTRSS